MSQRENNNERDAQKQQFAHQLLESYFMFRSNLPCEGYIQENKTTLQIMDELLPMMALSSSEVTGYMLNHDYATTTEKDGTVTWAIWRQV